MKNHPAQRGSEISILGMVEHCHRRGRREHRGCNLYYADKEYNGLFYGSTGE